MRRRHREWPKVRSADRPIAAEVLVRQEPEEEEEDEGDSKKRDDDNDDRTDDGYSE